MSPLGFEAGSLFAFCQRHICDIHHLRFTTGTGMHCQYSDQWLSPHVCLSRGRIQLPIHSELYIFWNVQGLFVPYLLPMTMYNLSLTKLCANYYGLPTSVQLQVAHKLMLSVQCLAGNCSLVLYCT